MSEKKQSQWRKVMDKYVDAMIDKLKRRELEGSGPVALHTAELLRTIISKGKYTSISELLNLIKTIGKKLIDARPIELALGNIVRRVLFIVRQEATAYIKEEKYGKREGEMNHNVDLSLSLHKLFDSNTDEVDAISPESVMPKGLRGKCVRACARVCVCGCVCLYVGMYVGFDVYM